VKTVIVVLAVPIPTGNGAANVLQHQRVKTADFEDGMLKIEIEDGTIVGYNANILVSYSVDPHGSILKAPAPAIAAP